MNTCCIVLLVPTCRLKSAEKSSFRFFSALIPSVVWDQCWETPTGNLYSQNAYTLNSLETASLHFQLHPEVSFGLPNFYYTTFLVC